MSGIVTVYGGSGFVGRHIARCLAKEGWRIRVACRRPNEAMFVKPYGVPGQVEPTFCNIRDDIGIGAAMQGADAVVNCVGTFDASGANSFEPVHVHGAGRIARIAAEHGIFRMVHISAIGADEAGESEYARTKAKGEREVLRHQPDAMILRPSVVFGAEDMFFNRFAGMARYGPVLPIVGADTKFQPVHVDDLARAAAGGVLRQHSGVYEIGGPEIKTFRELMTDMLETIQHRRMIVNIPFWAARVMAGAFRAGSTLSGGLLRAPITRDQVSSLRNDSVVSPGSRTLADLGIDPAPVGAVIPEYLWRFRPSGQYAAIKDSARNLRA